MDDDTMLDRLGSAKYLLLTTFRKDGTGVPTPVWVVRDGSTLGVWTTPDTGKVKRIRNRPEVLVGPCDFRGNPTGRQVPAMAELTDPATVGRYRELIKRKYGLPGRLTLLGSRLLRREKGAAGVRITLAD